MAKRGYGADATLVAAAYRLGQSYGPKDYTDIFKTQYEGLVKTYEAKYDAFSKGIESIGKLGEAFVKSEVKERKEDKALVKEDEKIADDFNKLGLGPDQTFDNDLNRCATEYCSEVIKSQGKNYQNKSLPPNKTIFEYEQAEFLKQKDKLDYFTQRAASGKITKKEKQERLDLVREIQKTRQTLNNRRGLYNATQEEWTSGFVDLKNTHKNNPDAMFLLSEVMKKDGDLKELGVTTFEGKDGKMHFKYPVGLGGKIYNKIADTPLMAPPTTQYATISEDQLFGGIKKVANNTRNSIKAVGVQVSEAARELSVNSTGKKKIESIKNFDSIANSTFNDVKAAISETNNYLDITTNDLDINGQTVNIEKDLNEYLEIDASIVSQMGIGSDVLTLDQIQSWDSNKDGMLNQTELNKHIAAKRILIDKITNPQGIVEKNISENIVAKHLVDYYKQGFNSIKTDMRAEIDDPTSIVPGGTGGYKNKKIEFTNPGGTKSEMWSDDIIKAQKDLKNIKKGGKVNVNGQHYGYDPKKGYFRISFSEDPNSKMYNKWFVPRDKGLPIGGYFKTVQEVLDDQNIPMQKTAFDPNSYKK